MRLDRGSMLFVVGLIIVMAVLVMCSYGQGTTALSISMVVL
jgi:hypothetical protein